jgi:hypothetical protein
MKAYNVYPGETPFDDGCVLVYAETRNKAKLKAYRAGPWTLDYIDFKAIRVPKFDEYYNGRQLIEENRELPEDAPRFFQRFFI